MQHTTWRGSPRNNPRKTVRPRFCKTASLLINRIKYFKLFIAHSNYLLLLFITKTLVCHVFTLLHQLTINPFGFDVQFFKRV